MPSGSSQARQIGAWVMINFLWLPITFQDTALLTIAVPATTARLAPANHVFVLSILASMTALATMLVPPVSGWLSDARRRRGGSRSSFVIAGLVIDVVALVGLAYANTLPAFAILLVVATLGSNVALSAYQAMLPEAVPRKHWGIVSGIRGVATLAGTVIGFAIAGLAPRPEITYLAAAGVMGVGAISLLGVREGKYGAEEEHAHVRDWHDFMVVFVGRALVFFGLTLLQTFVLYFFRDVLRLGNPSAGTALYAFATVIGAVASSVGLGFLSDRAPRKIITALACACLALATIGFAVAPELRWILPCAVLFGIGFGGVISSGWALAMDAVPKLHNVGRDLGLWGVATTIPSVIAPLLGGGLIGLFHGDLAGYQAAFGLAAFAFALASLTVLRVGHRPLSSLWAVPLRTASVIANYAWDHLAYRVRRWGKLPRRRGPTLIIANHQHDFESPAIVTTATVESGSWRHPVFTASSRRMYEPGFLATRLSWLSVFLRRVNAGPLFVSLGMLPIENELSSRELAAFAWAVARRHGPLPLAEIFDERVSSRFPEGATSSDLGRRRLFAEAHRVVKISTVRQPYRREILDETRAQVELDLTRMEDVVRRGGTFYLTPEGHYSTDGRMLLMRGAAERLAPLATIYVAGVSYDPFVARRFSMLYRMVRYGPLDPQRDDKKLTTLSKTLAATRPVVTSQLLGKWLDGRDGEFTFAEAVAAVQAQLLALPPQLFVDPELRRNPPAMVRRALPLMTRWKILECRDGRYRLGAVRRHPQFPFVGDIVAYQARFLEETIANADFAVKSS